MKVEKLPKKEKDSIKDEVITTLLSRAFSKKTQIRALILVDENLILIDSSSSTKAEEVLALLRKSLGSLPVIPLSFESPIELTLTSWISKNSAPPAFEVQDKAELRSISNEGGVAQFKNQELFEDEILAHIEAGKQVHKLALHFGNSVYFVINSDLSLKQIKFSEEFRASNDDLSNEDPMARMDADFILMRNELTALMNEIQKQFQ